MKAMTSHRLGPGTLTFGEVGDLAEFSAQLRSCTITPEIDEGDPLPVLSGDEQADDDESFTVAGSILQDYDLDSLLVWAHVNANTTVPFMFQPDNDKKLAVKGQVKVRRIAIGGDVKARNESDFEFPGVGMYDLVDSDTDAVVATWAAVATPSPSDGDW